MSRHRNVRSLNYNDECEGFDDVYGHSVEDDYSISPSAEQFMYDRNRQQSQMSAFFNSGDKITEEPELEIELSEIDKVRLKSCIDEIKNVVGEEIQEKILIQAVLRSGFDLNRALDMVLQQSTMTSQNAEVSKTVLKEDTATKDKVGSTSSPSNPVKVSQSKTVNVTKGFQLPATDGRLKADLTSPMDISPRSQSPSCESPDEGKSKTPDTSENTPKLPAKGKELRGEAAVARYVKERSGIKPLLHMVVIGHVDAGKSTLMGHLLYALGQVNQRTMHKYEQESKKIGKQSFMYAWILDETGEERSRGITMDVGQSRFETQSKSVVILDAPGHRDFIPNMISGATQADCAVLVVDAGRGEFESGFESGGQTREHALLVRSLGVNQLIVVVNKLDTVGWDENRFLEIGNKLGSFLRQAGFRDSDVCFVPCSGLSGQNLTNAPTENDLAKWYQGPSLLESIDKFKIPERPVSKPFRLSVNDIFKSTGSGFCVSGRIEAGSLQVGDRVLVQPQGETAMVKGDRVLVQPQGETAMVKGLSLDELSAQVSFAGDQVCVTLSGMEIQNVALGYVLCDPINPIPVTSKVEARIVLFNLQVPITQGYPVMVHLQSLLEQGTITKLVSQLHRGTGEVLRRRPRCLPKNTSAVIELTLARPIGVELYRDVKELGRFMLRSSGVTIAAGLVTKIF